MSFLHFASDAPEAIPIMPLVHTTDFYDFREIKQQGELQPSTCSVYGENLIYLFYGRPCFRKHAGKDPVSLNALHLVSLIFDAASLPAPKRVLPFDSGAFRAGLFAADLHPKMDLPHFELQPSAEGAARAVSRFFETNVGYYRAAIRSDLQVDAEELEVASYLSIASTVRQTAADDRRSAIEFQLAEIVRLSAAKVLAVILPDQFLDDPAIEGFIVDDLQAEAIGYFCPHARPAEDARIIMHEALRFYRREGLL